MVQLMGGNPFAPIGQGLRDIGQGYYQGQMAKMGMRERKEQREQQESHRKVTYGISLLRMAESPEDKRKIIERFIAPEMDGVLDDLDLFKDLPDTAQFLTDQHNLFTSGKQTPQQYLNNLQRFVFTHPKSEVGKEALEYRRDVAKEQRKLKAATAKDIAGWLAKGEIVEVPKGGMITDLEDKGTIFEYGGRQFYREEEPKEIGWKEKERFKTEEAIRKARALEKVKGRKEPTLVTWTTATKELKGRFGKQDPIGNIIITPELAGMHRIAQKQLVVLKNQGLKPLDAINKSEDFARNVESRYWQYIDAAGKDRDLQEKVKQAFKSKYNYLPRMRPIR